MKISAPAALALLLVSSGLLWFAGCALTVSAFVPLPVEIPICAAGGACVGGFIAAIAFARRIMGR